MFSVVLYVCWSSVVLLSIEERKCECYLMLLSDSYNTQVHGQPTRSPEDKFLIKQLYKLFEAGIREITSRKARRTCSFITRTFCPAYLRYSSRMALKHHFCNFRRHPITVPVRCLPRLHMTSAGYVEGWTRRWSARNTVSSVMGSHEFVLYRTPK